MSTFDATGTWTNWARTETATPTRIARPRDEEDIATLVAKAAADDQHVRAVGGGHSFTGAAVTDGLMLSLDAMDRVHRVEPQPDGTALVTVDAGMRLYRLNRVLDVLGYAMRNLGDIDQQSVAGAIGTGTHGTGARLGGIATQVRAVRVVGADGVVRDASPTENRELFEVARLGLGVTGILSTVTLEVVPAFLLRAREEPLPLGEVLADLETDADLVHENDHFELYWFPGTEVALTKRNNRLEPREPQVATNTGTLARARTWLDKEVVENGVLGAVNRISAAAPRTTTSLNRFIAGALSARTWVAPSHQVFVTARRVRFREMEYALPREALVPVLREVDAWLRSSGEPVPFPVEVRFAARDDIWLSTAQGRDSAYLAVHQYARMDHSRYFAAVERIVAQVGGRPHWGKLHTLDAARVTELYPHLADVNRVRFAQDPAGVFANPYTDRVLGARQS